MLPHCMESQQEVEAERYICQLSVMSTATNRKSKMDSTKSTMTISSAPVNNFNFETKVPPVGTPTTKQQQPDEQQKQLVSLSQTQQQQQHHNHQHQHDEERNNAQSNASQNSNTYRTLDQYRMHLYNYALNIERFRCPTYTTAAAMAAAAAFVNTNNGNKYNSKSDGVTDKCDSNPTETWTGTVDNEVGSEVGSYHSGSGVGGRLSVYSSQTTAAIVAAAAAASGYIPHHNKNSNSPMLPHQEQLRQRLAYSGHTFPQNPHSMALSMSLFPSRNIFQPEEPKPQHSYIGLIAMAILSSPESKLVLSDIYQYILDNYPYFRTRGPGWRNSIRHNLSLNDCFVKSGRSANGKGHYWAIHPANMDDFRKGDFRRRKAQRKVRKHMGLSVDDGGTDSPSPPPLDLTPPPANTGSVLAQPMVANPFSAAHHLAAAAAFGYMQHHQHHHRLTAYHQHLQQHPHHYINNSPFTNNYPIGNTHYQQQQQHQPCYPGPHPQSYHGDNSHPHDLPISHQEAKQNAEVYPMVEAPVKVDTSTRTTRTKIANLYSKTTRKRQFDVASLLAPDIRYDDDSIVNIDDNGSNDEMKEHDSDAQREGTCSNGKGGNECCQTITIIDNVDDSDVEAELADTVTTTTTEHTTVITKLSVQHQYQFRHQYRKKNKFSLHRQNNPGKVMEQQEQCDRVEIADPYDIDVVASDIEDNDGCLKNCENEPSEESYEEMLQRPDQNENDHYIHESRGIDMESGKHDRHGPSTKSFHDQYNRSESNAPIEIPVASVDKDMCRKLNLLGGQIMPMSKALGHQQHQVDTQIFGRYYGTYMATTEVGNSVDLVVPKNVPHPQYFQQTQKQHKHQQQEQHKQLDEDFP